MRLHTDKLTHDQIYDALFAAKNSKRMTEDVYMVTLATYGSRTRKCAYEIQLGTDDKTTGPTRSRHYKNSGNYGADTQVWAATYDEWGYFIAELFKRDPDLTFGHYKSLEMFNAMTDHKYE